MKNPEAKQFGHRKLDQNEDKMPLVNGVFSSVAHNYDVMNDAMSLGIHRIWKDRFIRMIRPKRHHKMLDVAGGTGDIAFRLFKKARPESPITVFDLNQDMLDVGQDRAIDQGILDHQITWQQGNAEKLPFKDHSFDLYTIAFGLRNVPHIDTALAEAYRVLKPGGRFFCLEFSHVDDPMILKAYRFYNKNILPGLGQMIAKDKDSYVYLAESIEQHPTAENLRQRLANAGYEKASFTKMSLGIVAVHSGVKI